MQPNSVRGRGLTYKALFPAAGAAALAIALWLVPAASRAGGVVTNCTEAELRAAMAGGRTVTFACDGTITLTSTITNTLDTLLDATGHQITISGGDTVGVFYVQTNVTFSVNSLAIAHGRSTNNGAAICNQNGTVNATNTTFSSNQVRGAAGPSYPGTVGGSVAGGAVANAGVINLVNCTFIGNSAVGGAGSSGPPGSGIPGFAGGSGTGGAVWNSGVLGGSGCTFAGNSAAGGIGGNGAAGHLTLPARPGGPGGAGSGGALFNSGAVNLVNCSMASNQARGGAGGAGGYQGMSHGGDGGAGGSGGSGEGGAIYNSGAARMVSTTFTSNSGSGSSGGTGGRGGSGYYTGGGNGGDGGSGGSGVGTLSSPGEVQLVNCTFASNSGSGGNGGAGGAGGNEAIFGRGGNGGDGGNGGSGFGGISGYSSCRTTNCTLARNSGSGATGGAGGSPGPGFPGGSPGASGSTGSGGGGILAIGSQLVNTLLGDNTPGGNCSGTITDLGYNLSSDNSCGFTNVGSMNNTPPLLSTLADNGGPTRTIALLPGSPAIDAGNTTAAPVMDQRGFPRPAGARADIGAFEYGSTLPVLSIAGSDPGLLNILVQGNSNQWCRLLVSSNLSFWVSVSTNQIGGDGTVLLPQTRDVTSAGWFYRLAMP